MAYKTNLVNADATFASMMENGFGIITVMNAKVYDAPDSEWFAARTAYRVVKEIADEKDLLCELDTLKIANVTEEGPTKTITGGKYSNALVKFGKSARLEMQDALGRAKSIDALCGGVREWAAGNVGKTTGLHFGEDFQGPKTIIGESFFIDRNTGKQIDVNIVFYQFLPDSIFNLTQDAEGDASVFDMNGDLLTTEVLLGTDGDTADIHGVFYSIIGAQTTSSGSDDDDDDDDNNDSVLDTDMKYNVLYYPKNSETLTPEDLTYKTNLNNSSTESGWFVDNDVVVYQLYNNNSTKYIDFKLLSDVVVDKVQTYDNTKETWADQAVTPIIEGEYTKYFAMTSPSPIRVITKTPAPVKGE